jgi:FAD/FMN-containing dehydrogenase
MNTKMAEPAIEASSGASISNFGGNIKFNARYSYAPRTEEEALEILDRHSSGKVRVAGARHSWSDAAASEDVLLDLRHLNQVDMTNDPDGKVTVTAGGGCTIQRLLRVLHQKSDATLPTLGAIKKQTIAGAISTGTHGSGNASLSHYMDEVRVAAYDPHSGRARIYVWDGGKELRGARCAVGCMGVILSVKFHGVPKYYVEEAVVQQDSLEEVVAGQAHYPLQQFVLIPYRWTYFAYQRRTIEAKTGSWYALAVYWARANKLLGVDFSLHLLLKLMLMLASSTRGSSRLIGWFYRAVLPVLIGWQKRKVVDFSEEALTMRHDLFRHLEMEVFVPLDRLPGAVSLVRSVMPVFAGFSDDIPGDIAEQLSSIDKLDELTRLKGDYTHHYPIFFRYVLQDDTLISMTSGPGGSYYSISFFTYLAPESREHFYRFARFIAQCLTRLFQARLHWGKYYPLTFSEIKHQSPRLGEFRELCNQVDPRGVFQNDYTRRVLGFDHIGDKAAPASDPEKWDSQLRA